ncbi:MAG: DUF1573 domain-containing protein [Isosphaeraceae bacterium]
MKRWTLLALGVVVVSTGITLGLQYLPAGVTAEDIVPGPAGPTGPVGAATVEGGETQYDFGAMAQEALGSHEWILKNTGEGDLSLRVGASSCSCTIANIDKGESKILKPGESTEIRLGWNTKKNNGRFSQSSEIITNDPKTPKIKFIIQGDVRPALIMLPLSHDSHGFEGLYFAAASNDQAHNQAIAVVSPTQPDFRITKASVGDGSRFDVEVKPLDQSRLDALKNSATQGFFATIQGGYEVTVTLKPSPTLGDIQDELVIETDHPDQHLLKAPVGGRIVGPISFAPSTCQFTALSRRGASRDVTVLVRNQDETTFQVEAPEGLEATIAPTEQRTKAADGSTRLRTYKMTLNVPAGSSPAVIRGEVIIKTDHPNASEVRLPVAVTVVNGG